MTGLLPLALAALETEDDQLGALGLAEHLGLDRGTLDGGLADLHATLVADEKDVVEGDLTAGGHTVGQVAEDLVADPDGRLVRTVADDRVHGLVASVFTRGGVPPAGPGAVGAGGSMDGEGRRV